MQPTSRTQGNYSHHLAKINPYRLHRKIYRNRFRMDTYRLHRTRAKTDVETRFSSVQSALKLICSEILHGVDFVF